MPTRATPWANPRSVSENEETPDWAVRLDVPESDGEGSGPGRSGAGSDLGSVAPRLTGPPPSGPAANRPVASAAAISVAARRRAVAGRATRSGWLERACRN